MIKSDRKRRQLGLVAGFILFGVIVGAIYGAAITLILIGLTLEALLLGLLRGIITGGLIGGIIGGFELFYASAPVGQPFRKLPFRWVLTWRVLIYAFTIVTCDKLGELLVPIDNSQPVALNLATLVTLVISLLFSFAVNFMFWIAQTLGPGVLPSFLGGRYHQPRQETRLFLFIDIRGSSAIAERIGDLDFLRLLNLFMTDIGDVVHRFGGRVHKYVGDEVIATWTKPDHDGTQDTKNNLAGKSGWAEGALHAVFAARDRLAEQATLYHRQFGLVPEFRAVLHAGPVVVGEMGEIKREIALLGDTINSTAKLEQLAKAQPYDIVASQAALDAIGDLGGIDIQPLGPQAIPGKRQEIVTYAIRGRI